MNGNTRRPNDWTYRIISYGQITVRDLFKIIRTVWVIYSLHFRAKIIINRYIIIYDQLIFLFFSSRRWKQIPSLLILFIFFPNTFEYFGQEGMNGNRYGKMLSYVFDVYTWSWLIGLFHYHYFYYKQVKHQERETKDKEFTQSFRW